MTAEPQTQILNHCARHNIYDKLEEIFENELLAVDYQTLNYLFA